MSVAPAAAFALNECRFKLKIRDGLDFPHVRKDITVKAHHPQYGCVGTLYAHRIDRKPCQVRGDFHQIMDTSETDDLPHFATTLFDKYGMLRPEFTANQFLKGTGAFGDELNDGILLVVPVVRVQEEFRGRGIASQLLSALAHSSHGAEAVGIMACPRPVDRIEDREMRVAQKGIAVNLFLKNSYRRIGRTCFLAYAIDSEHPSRFISIEDDVPDPRELFREARTRLAGSGPDSTNHETNIDGDEFSGFSLHNAAFYGYLPAVRALLAVPLKDRVLDQLFSRDNEEGLTPLEACELHQRRLREEQEIDPLQLWCGYDPCALRVIYLLKRAMGEDVGMSEDEFVGRRRYGCSCQQCTDGWLSPRMRYALSYLAEGNIDLIREATEYCGSGPISFEDLPGYEHFPPTMQRAGIVSKMFCKGYANVTHAIVHVLLKLPGIRGIPTAENVTATLRAGSTTTFFKKGGRVEHALDYILTTATAGADDYYTSQSQDNAARRDPPRRLANQSDEDYELVCHFIESGWGDIWQNKWVSDILEDATYSALPACENDMNFALVALKLGLNNPERFLPPPPRPCGLQGDWNHPHSDSDSETGSGSESADEEDEEDDEDDEDGEDDEDDEIMEPSEEEDDVGCDEDDEEEDTYKEPPRKRVRL